MYPGVSHLEIFELKIYQMACSTEHESFEYQVGNDPISIAFGIVQQPDYLARPNFTVVATNVETNEIDSSSLVQILSASSSNDAVMLEIVTEDNSLAGNYRVDLVAEFSGAEKICSVGLEIEANQFYWSHSAPDPPP